MWVIIEGEIKKRHLYITVTLCTRLHIEPRHLDPPFKLGYLCQVGYTMDKLWTCWILWKSDIKI